MSELRERIADAADDFLSDNFHAYLERDVALELADAVIAELGLREEQYRSALCPDDQDYDKVRLVTNWQSPNPT